MIDTITLTEVTDVITPSAETDPENYNFSIESTWTETEFTSDGSNVGKASQYVEFTPVSDGTAANKLDVQLTPPTSSNYLLFVWIKDRPTQPRDGYIAMAGSYSNGMCASHMNGILRPNGTIGSDPELFTFNATTGSLKLGGQYGTFYAGLTYCVLLVEA